jgi:hypothetical protein
VFLVAEPEAAALYTIKTQFEIEGNNFMIVRMSDILVEVC